MISQDRLDYIESLALKATRGEWMAVGRWVENTDDDLPDIVQNDGLRGGNDSDKQMRIDAEYIAAVQPRNIFSILDRLEEADALNSMIEKITEWSSERGIYKHSTAQAQTLKAVSEMGELADAIIKNRPDEIKDAIGDVIVCLINVAHMTGLTLAECLDAAWGQIKDRKGRMVPGGAFVKEEDKP